MDTSALIASIDTEIARLTQARTAIAAINTGAELRRRGRPKGSTKAVGKKTAGKKRTMSPEGRARIAAAQKARWAASKKSVKVVKKAPAKAITKWARKTGKKAAPTTD